MAAINSAEEAADWAYRSLAAKNTLTATDAKIVEERFQERLSTFNDSLSANEPAEVRQCNPLGTHLLEESHRGVTQLRDTTGGSISEAEP